VKILVELVYQHVNDSKRDMITGQSLTLLAITLDEIYDYLVLFTNKTSNLATHVIKYGSDEEQFIKWAERLQHCAAELKIDAKMLQVFDQLADFQDYQKDISGLQQGILELLVMVEGKDNTVLQKSLDALVGHQTKVRSTYRTKTDPYATAEINPKSIQYDRIIGHGGMICFSTRFWCSLEREL
jgi:hypothetical protein